jgi:hypothetical protein
MPPAQAKQLTAIFGTRGQSAEGPIEGSYTTDWPPQLHLDEIPTGEEVLVGTFFLNEHPIIILFDSGASHDFMRSTCAKKANYHLWPQDRYM